MVSRGTYRCIFLFGILLLAAPWGWASRQAASPIHLQVEWSWEAENLKGLLFLERRPGMPLQAHLLLEREAGLPAPMMIMVSLPGERVPCIFEGRWEGAPPKAAFAPCSGLWSRGERELKTHVGAAWIMVLWWEHGEIRRERSPLRLQSQ
ncbi:MAG: hypothetical protein QJR00_08220 [Bacillota bacterium]|nr:hypothetical protein [Bacillota bacterium]